MENSRYYRQLMLPEVGEEGQRKLLAAKVLIVGVGGLGSPLSMYLAGAGVGNIGIVDNDVVSLNNLPRQVLYTDNQIGLPKVYCAAERLRAMNPEIFITPYNVFLDANNAEQIVSQYDIVADGCDNFATRYLLSDTCQKLGKPYVYAAIRGLEGQVSVLCGGNPRNATYRTIYPDEASMIAMPHPGKQILGSTPCHAASIQTTEVIKLICGFGDTLQNRLLMFDLAHYQNQIVELC
ncbi:MAG: HesA/MoeB/ThiF family protein [Bacteroidales bacterium]|nr:HesA/MoeB/ThiF family protein [Bacteroidales bacterium]